MKQELLMPLLRHTRRPLASPYRMRLLNKTLRRALEEPQTLVQRAREYVLGLLAEEGRTE